SPHATTSPTGEAGATASYSWSESEINVYFTDELGISNQEQSYFSYFLSLLADGLSLWSRTNSKYL
ncbi:MAG TPA: hypothetical protein DC054_00685, partial [Blastocatellia bacterium]|nr:hypothetical protein [Blastocatellia bacterium]